MDVYEPREDSYMLLRHVERLAKPGCKVLDMGTGSGIQAIAAAKVANRVVAADINPDAIKYAKEAAESERLKNIKFIVSDLFKKIPKIKFDLIVFNPPYLPEEKNVEDIALYSAKRGTKTTVRFLDELNNFLTENGDVLFTGSSLASSVKINEAIKDNLLESELLEKEHVFFEDIYVLRLWKSGILKKLESLGVRSLRRFARGKRGVIITGNFRNKKVAVKIKSEKSASPGTINIEAKFLEILNKYDIGPRLIMHKDDFLMYGFVRGVFIEEFIEKSSKSEIRAVLKKVFEQLYLMDSLKINKFEMQRPVKHIIISDGNPVLIDFERARFTENPKNVTQFCDYLAGSKISAVLETKGIFAARDSVIGMAREYKNEPSSENFKKIISAI